MIMIQPSTLVTLAVLQGLLLLLLVVTASVQACTPGCQPLTAYNDSAGGEAAAYILPSLLLDRGACYSAPGTRSSVSGGNTTWSPSSPTQLPPSFEQSVPTLDLCNQVHSIWLPQGERVHDARCRWMKPKPPKPKAQTLNPYIFAFYFIYIYLFAFRCFFFYSR